MVSKSVRFLVRDLGTLELVKIRDLPEISERAMARLPILRMTTVANLELIGAIFQRVASLDSLRIKELKCKFSQDFLNCAIDALFTRTLHSPQQMHSFLGAIALEMDPNPSDWLIKKLDLLLPQLSSHLSLAFEKGQGPLKEKAFIITIDSKGWFEKKKPLPERLALSLVEKISSEVEIKKEKYPCVLKMNTCTADQLISFLQVLTKRSEISLQGIIINDILPGFRDDHAEILAELIKAFHFKEINFNIDGMTQVGRALLRKALEEKAITEATLAHELN